MPILWIEEESPLTVKVEKDGEIRGQMTVEGVHGKDAVWRLTDLENPRPANPVYDEGFRMREDADGKHVLGIEFRPAGEDEDRDGPAR